MENISYLLYTIAWQIIRLMPEKLAYGVSSVIASFIAGRGGTSIKRLQFNLSRIHPAMPPAELAELSKAGMKSYLRYWFDVFRLPYWNRRKLIERVLVLDEHHLLDALAAGSGAIAVLPHSGNWDHAGAYYCAKGIPIVTVAEHLKPERLFRKFLAFRQSLGMEVVDASARAIGTLAKRAREGRMLALVADRDLSRNGVPVNFFNHPAKMPAGPALLHLQTGAALVVAHVWYESERVGSRLFIKFHPPLKLPKESENWSNQEKINFLTQSMADLFALGIAEHSSDWHMLQRIWLDDPNFAGAGGEKVE